MNTLAIDSSHDVIHLALKTDKKHYSISYTIGRRYTEELMMLLEEALKRCELRYKDLDLLVCSKGPGSFTGLRVAMATMKGISLALNIPYVSISTLETFSYPLTHTHHPLLVVLDAKKQRYYGALFEKGVRKTDDLDLTIEQLCNLVTKYEFVIISGPDAKRVLDKMNAIGDKFASFPTLILDNIQNRDYGPAMIVLGEAQFKSVGKDDITSGPTYVRLSDAEVSLKENRQI